jgi:hypothetical protein
MIPTLIFRPEYAVTNPPKLLGFHFMDEAGKTVGVLPLKDAKTLCKYVDEHSKTPRKYNVKRVPL